MEAVLTRLEAVTTRLEAFEAGRSEKSQTLPSAQKASITPPKFSVALPGLASPGKEPHGLRPSKNGAPESKSAVLEAWDTNTTPAIAELLKVAEGIGGEVLLATQVVEDTFKAERTVVAAIASCQQPDATELAALVAPVAAELQRANGRTEGRRTAAFNHNKAVAEALQATVWVVYTGPSCGMSPPGVHVQEAWQSAEFWANKILIEFRATDKQHVAWVKGLSTLLTKLKEYVEQHHPRGPAWNAAGGSVSAFSAGAAPSAAKSNQQGQQGAAREAAKANAAPPPPPPPAAGALLQRKEPGSGKAPGAAPAAGLGAVFSQINSQGESVTAGLRKVTDDMKSKNRTDRSGLVSAARPAASSVQATASTRAGEGPKGASPPRIECQQGRKWVVEHHSGNRAIVVSDTTPKQSVYIYRCRDCTIQVKGKVNAITIDQCSKTGVVFESLLASCELVNCSGVQVQATGIVPTLAVDKSDDVQLYLSEASLAASITTAKSSSVNVIVPGAPGQDMIELFVPEQFVSSVRGGRLVTEPVSHSGG